MLSLARNGYTAQVVQDALHGKFGFGQIAFRYDLLNASNVKVRELTNVLSGSITHDALADIKRTARFEIRDDGTIDFNSHRIKVWARVYIPPGRVLRDYYYLSPTQALEDVTQLESREEGWAEFPKGVFLLSSSTQKVDRARQIIRPVEAYDQTVILLGDKTIGRYFLPAGTNVITAVKSLLEGAGIAKHNLVASTKVTPGDKEWEANTPKLRIINDLLELVNYYGLYFDDEGVAVAAPYVLPEHAASQYAYADDSQSVILAGTPQKEMDTFNIPNQWVLQTNDADRTLTAVYTNSSPASPTSTVRRGTPDEPRYIVKYETADAVDQATLDALVQRRAVEETSIYEHFRFETSLMPQHTHMDDFTITNSALGISAVKVREVGWSMDLSAKGRMTHDVRRRVTV